MTLLSTLVTTFRTKAPRSLVNYAPKILSVPAKLTPFPVQKELLGRILQRVFAEALADGDLEFLEDRWLKIEIRDLAVEWFFTYQSNQLVMSNQCPEADVVFSSDLNGLILIAGRKADPDTLFFQRRLQISGDTELGLEIKNLIDSIELESLPPFMHRALSSYAALIEEAEEVDSPASQFLSQPAAHD